MMRMTRRCAVQGQDAALWTDCSACLLAQQQLQSGNPLHAAQQCLVQHAGYYSTASYNAHTASAGCKSICTYIELLVMLSLRVTGWCSPCAVGP
jgi:hypothetical protein